MKFVKLFTFANCKGQSSKQPKKNCWNALAGQVGSAVTCINKEVLFVFISSFKTFWLYIAVGFCLLKQRSLKCLLFALHRYSCLRFVRTEEICGGELPLPPAGFVDTVRRHCVEAHGVLLNKSVPPVVTVGRWVSWGLTYGKGCTFQIFLLTWSSSKFNLYIQVLEFWFS